MEHERCSRQPVTPGQLHYSYKQFCKLYDHYVDVNDLTAQLTHLPGDHMFVDWSGDCMTVVDPLTGIRSVANIFVASLPHSGMIFAVATPDMKMRAWLSSHQDAFDYFGGRPMKITPDNASTATNQLFKGGSLRDVNAEYFRFSQHFGVGITPAHPLKPRDKAHVQKPSILFKHGSLNTLMTVSFTPSKCSTPLLPPRWIGSMIARGFGVKTSADDSCS